MYFNNAPPQPENELNPPLDMSNLMFPPQQINEVIQGEHFQKMMPMNLDENMRSMMVQNLFTMADKNRDGHLDPSEFTQLSKMGSKAMKKKKTSEEL